MNIRESEENTNSKNEHTDKQEKKKVIDLNQIIKNIGMEKLLIIAVCGVVLVILSIPTDKKSGKTDANTTLETTKNEISLSSDEYCAKLEERLKTLISKIDGVEQVEVMITLKCGSESVVLTEVTYEQNEKKDTGSNGVVSEQQEYKNESTVVYEKDEDGNTIPYVIKENVPQIEGIAVVAKGGDNAENILKITSIAQALFNVEAHKISVIGIR